MQIQNRQAINEFLAREGSPGGSHVRALVIRDGDAMADMITALRDVLVPLGGQWNARHYVMTMPSRATLRVSDGGDPDYLGGINFTFVSLDATIDDESAQYRRLSALHHRP